MEGKIRLRKSTQIRGDIAKCNDTAKTQKIQSKEEETNRTVIMFVATLTK